MHGFYRLLENKYYVDELYGAAIVKPLIALSRDILWRAVDAGAIDGAVNDSATGARALSNGARRMQSGNIRSYAGWVAAGAALLTLYMVWLGAH